jgi:hypothetical protein
LEHVLFFHILGIIIIPTDELHDFSEGLAATTNQYLYILLSIFCYILLYSCYILHYFATNVPNHQPGSIFWRGVFARWGHSESWPDGTPKRFRGKVPLLWFFTGKSMVEAGCISMNFHGF